MSGGTGFRWLDIDYPSRVGTCEAGDATLTAANGDQVLLLLTDAQEALGGWGGNDYDIVGGTGRFVPAMGEIVQQFFLDHATLTWIATPEAWISY